MDATSPKAPQIDLLPQSVANLPLPVHVILGKTTLPLKEVCKLAVGSLVDFGQPASQPADLLLKGRVLARGQLVVLEGNYGFEVLALCPK